MKTEYVILLIGGGIIAYILYTAKKAPATPTGNQPKGGGNTPPPTQKSHAQQVADVQASIFVALNFLSSDQAAAVAASDAEKDVMMAAACLANGYDPLNFATSEFSWVTGASYGKGVVNNGQN